MTSELTYDADPLTVGFGPIEARGAKQNTEEGHVKTTLAVILLWILVRVLQRLREQYAQAYQ